MEQTGMSETIEPLVYPCAKTIQIEGVDIEAGLRNCNNCMDVYLEVLDSFMEDVHSKVQELKPLAKRTFIQWNEADLHLLSRVVHAIKGVSAIIGARILLKKTIDLETAIKTGCTDTIAKDFPEFFQDLKTITERIHSVLQTTEKSAPAEE